MRKTRLLDVDSELSLMGLKRFFGGSSVALVRCLVESGDMSPAELAELQKLVRGHVGRKGGES